MALGYALCRMKANCPFHEGDLVVPKDEGPRSPPRGHVVERVARTSLGDQIKICPRHKGVSWHFAEDFFLRITLIDG